MWDGLGGEQGVAVLFRLVGCMIWSKTQPPGFHSPWPLCNTCDNLNVNVKEAEL